MTIHHGDCLDILPTLDAESVHAIVTDPPYGLGFMGKAWDHGCPGIPFWAAMLRVAKPGAHLLAFGGTRTYHRLACAIEDAGWEIRDTLVWAYASGFPKSRNLDGEWQGWGTALKPAWEPIVLARKPLRGTVAANVTEYGTGALNIDGCRIGPEGGTAGATAGPSLGILGDGLNGARSQPVPGLGRWPANLILTDPIFDGDTPGVVGGGWQEGGGNPRWRSGEALQRSYSGGLGSGGDQVTGLVPVDTVGTYSRFFLIPKAARADREPVIASLPERRPPGWSSGEQSPGTFQSQPTTARQNVHPTVKPTELMRHLVRLVTPPGGMVLDPFLGSGTTALACEAEGFAWIGIEREAEYVAIAEARLNGHQRGLGLVG